MFQLFPKSVHKIFLKLYLMTGINKQLSSIFKEIHSILKIDQVLGAGVHRYFELVIIMNVIFMEI